MHQIFHLIMVLGTLVALIALTSTQVQGQEREWTSKDGRTISATLLDVDQVNKAVSLARADGAKFQIPIASLSLNDQAYIQNNLAKFAWIEIPALAPDDPKLQSAMKSIGLGKSIPVTYVNRNRKETFEITQADPLGYRERHLSDFSGEIPEKMAIDNEGNLLFITLKTKPTAIHQVSKDGILTQIYETPETRDCSIRTPVIGKESQLAAVPKGGFFLRSRWKEVSNQNGNLSYKSRLNYFTMRVTAGKPAFAPHFSEASLPMSSGLQTLEAFAGDRLIAHGFQTTLHDIPPSSSKVTDHSIHTPSDTSWSFKLQTRQVISKAQFIAEAANRDFQIIFLVDLEKKTFSPLGPVATTEEEKESQPRYLATSPNGRHLVYFNATEQGFKKLEIAE